MPDAGSTSSVHAPGGRSGAVRRSTTGTVGLLLSGRYRLDDRRARDGGSSTWDGHDEQLDRGVLVRMVSGPHVDDALDAARRAAGLEERRLSRVLDVGTARATDGSVIGWVVEERPGGERLSDRLAHGPLDPASARAVVGEAAQALDHAAAAGLHHRRLTPGSIFVQDADVVVSGLVVAAAAAGLDDVPAGQADREDAVALVAVLYSALTGRWPHGPLDRLDGAPRGPAGPVPVGELVRGVPHDLDTLASVTLGPFEDGPFTPGEVAQQLAPWAPLGGASTQRSARGPLVLPPTGAARAAGGQEAPEQPTGRRARPGAGGTPQAPPAGRAADGTPRRAPRPLAPLSRPVTRPAAARSSGRTSGPVRTTGSPGRTSSGSTGPLRRHHTGDLDPLLAALAGSRGPASPASPASTGSTPSSGDGTGATTGGARSAARLTGGIAGGVPAADAPTRRLAGRWAAAVLAAVVLVSGVVAWQQLPQLRGALGIAPAAEGAPVLPTDGSVPGPAASDQPSAAAPPPPVAIAGLRTLDPLGDATENDERLPRALDGDPASSWDSSTYKTAAFGGLKAGVGLDVALAAEAPVTAVELLVGGAGGTVEVRSSPDGSFESSTVLATASVGDGAGGPVTVTLPEPVTTSHVVLWFTTLPTTSDGFVVQLYSVTVR